MSGPLLFDDINVLFVKRFGYTHPCGSVLLICIADRDYYYYYYYNAHVNKAPVTRWPRDWSVIIWQPNRYFPNRCECLLEVYSTCTEDDC